MLCHHRHRLHTPESQWPLKLYLCVRRQDHIPIVSYVDFAAMRRIIAEKRQDLAHPRHRHRPRRHHVSGIGGRRSAVAGYGVDCGLGTSIEKSLSIRASQGVGRRE